MRRPALGKSVLACVALSVFVFAAQAEAKKPSDPEELFNPLLGVEYSHWLVGPIVEIATEDEVEEYLLLTSDEEAETFIDAFWERRAEGLGPFDKTPRQVFEARVEEADKRFTEAAYSGSRTDRGTIFIVYGEPDEIAFEEADRKAYAPTVETWKYGKDAEPGLDGEKPKARYRFVKIDELTVFFNSVNRRRLEALRKRRGGFQGL